MSTPNDPDRTNPEEPRRARGQGRHAPGDGDAGYGSDEPTQGYDAAPRQDRPGHDPVGDETRAYDVDESDQRADARREADRREADRRGVVHDDGVVHHGTAPVAGAGAAAAREEVVAREKEEFGGMKLGSAFFGWLCAMGMTVLLTALVAGAGAAIGIGARVDPEQAAEENAETIGIVGTILVLLILFVAYYCGGYVAGRMARFSGAKQGLAVWLWAIIIAIVLAIVTAIAGAQWNVLADLNTFPRLPFNEGELTTLGIVTAVGALLASLAGAVLGGLAGMRFHRRVDRVGFGR